MIGASVDFPGLAKLRQMGQQMMAMRRAGMQSQSAALQNQTFLPEVQGMEARVQGVPEFGAGGEDPAFASANDPSTQMSRDIPEPNTPQLPSPPATSMIRDVKPRGLSSYRSAGQRNQQRLM